MLDELRYAVRSLSRRPGFAVVAVLTLAFGIGVNATVFSLVSALFLQPLNVKDPHQLVMLMQRGDIIEVPYGHSFPDYLDYRQSVGAFSHLAAFMPTPVHLSAGRQVPERTWIEVVSPDYFALAGVSPAIGTLLRPGEGESRGTAPTVVLAHRYWQRRFGSNPSIVGESITLNGRTFMVIGVAPETFTGLSWAMAVSAWVPAGALEVLMGSGGFLENRGAPAFRVMGRLAPGRTLSDARAEVEVAARRLAAEYPEEHKGTRPLLIPENRARPDPSVADFLPVFAAVFAILVGLVLFIACANVANLMLSRAIERQRDLVIRAALGASRGRLIRVHVLESLVLAAAAGLIGLLLARWAGQALAGFTPATDIPVNQDHATDWRVYAFTILIAAVAGVATALWPARQASRFNVMEALKEGGASVGSPRHTVRNLLVVTQVAFSLVVLASAGLFVHSLRELQRLPLGFQPDGLLMLSVDLGLQQYSDERGRQFIDDLLSRANAIPGVSAATVSGHVPMDYGMMATDVGIEGVIPGTKDDYLLIAFTVVGPDFLPTIGARLVRGRDFDPSDHERSRRVALVNETMSRKLWPGADPVGRRFRVGRDGEWTEVIGVVGDGKYVMLGEEPRPYFFLPIAQHYRSPVTLLVRSATDPQGVLAPLQQALRSMDADLPVFNVRTMESHLTESVFGFMPLRMGVALAAGQGLVGVLLALMGLYAVVSYAVARRTREIGIRMALGAERRDVLRLVLREGLRLTAIGIVLGLLVSVGLGFVLSQVLYGVKPVDVGVFLTVSGLLLGVSVLACYVPARRATRVTPVVALRAE